MINFIFNFQEKRNNTKMAKLNTTEHTFVEVIEIKKEEESTVDLNDPLNVNNDSRIKKEKGVDEFSKTVTAANYEEFRCEICSMIFNKRDLLEDHIKSYHKGQKISEAILDPRNFSCLQFFKIKNKKCLILPEGSRKIETLYYIK